MSPSLLLACRGREEVLRERAAASARVRAPDSRSSPAGAGWTPSSWSQLAGAVAESHARAHAARWSAARDRIALGHTRIRASPYPFAPWTSVLPLNLRRLLCGNGFRRSQRGCSPLNYNARQQTRRRRRRRRRRCCLLLLHPPRRRRCPLCRLPARRCCLLLLHPPRRRRCPLCRLPAVAAPARRPCRPLPLRRRRRRRLRRAARNK